MTLPAVREIRCAEDLPDLEPELSQLEPGDLIQATDEDYRGNGMWIVGRDGRILDGGLLRCGSDDHFTDFIDYLLSLGCDACRAVVDDPEAFVPPRNWTHFTSRDGVRYPRTMEGFLGDLVHGR